MTMSPWTAANQTTALRFHQSPRGLFEPTSLSRDQVNTIVIFERVGASLSVTGVLLILIAFAAFKRLRTVPNTFIIFASFANLGASIACLIGYAGIEAGADSALCQTQAFMFEMYVASLLCAFLPSRRRREKGYGHDMETADLLMCLSSPPRFMQSDPWWSFAMAVNVYMVFFFAANPNSFLGYWWAYFCICYGIPFIPAIWLLVARGEDRVQVYGNATLWCWIDKDWSNLRIYTYYLPIWVCILLSTCIYIAVGYYVFKQRNQLRNLSLSNPTENVPVPRDSGEKKLFSNAAIMGSIATTEVTQTSTVHRPNPNNSGQSSRSHTAINWFDEPAEDEGQARLDLTPEQSTSQNQYHTVTRITADPVPKKSMWAHLRKAYTRWCSKFNNMDPVKLAYLRTSFVFAISVLVTWTPSSINRVHDLVNPNEVSFGINLAAGIVLPLQGVWNSVIFFSTSSTALKEEIRNLRDRVKGLPRGHLAASAVRDERERERAVELERRVNRGLSKDDSGSEVTGSTMRVLRDTSLTSL
ncbi:G-protein coupled receptor [Apiospora hydei]|uniref:G-protein coupled receptor n=1 Tax=Apiospora hydei TaxID=1337664 RepID=A0ABR1X0S7_9PEZI